MPSLISHEKGYLNTGYTNICTANIRRYKNPWFLKAKAIHKKKKYFCPARCSLRSENISPFHSDKGKKLQDLILGKNCYVILPRTGQEGYLKFKIYLPPNIYFLKIQCPSSGGVSPCFRCHITCYADFFLWVRTWSPAGILLCRTWEFHCSTAILHILPKRWISTNFGLFFNANSFCRLWALLSRVVLQQCQEQPKRPPVKMLVT